jgi:hypothetical protein
MRTSVAITFVAALLALVSCSNHPPAGAGVADPAYSTDAYCQIAGLAGLYDWTGSAFVVCPGAMTTPGDSPMDGSACTVSTVGADGRAMASNLLDVQGAQVMSDGRILVWSFDGSLTMHQSGMSPTTIAPLVLDPWLDAMRNRIAYVAPAVGASTLEPGDDRRVVIYDIATQVELEAVADSTASSPVIVPGTDQVLYVSSSSGATAVWTVTATAPSTMTDPMPDACAAGRAGDPMDPMNTCQSTMMGAFGQLTNLTPDVPQTNYPPFGRQHVFVGEADTLRLVYAAPMPTADGTLRSEIFTLDPRTGDSVDLGPGAYPQHGPQSSVLARTGTDMCTAVQYLALGAQP